MTDKQTIQKVLSHEFGLNSGADYFLMWSEVHQRWEFYRNGKVTYGSGLRAIIRAVQRCIYAERAEAVA